MELETAIDLLKTFVKINTFKHDFITAVDTVLKALDERYNKGYQDGFKQAKFDCEMDKLDGR